MPLVTTQRWANRGGAVEALDLDNGVPWARTRSFGVTWNKRLTHAIEQLVENPVMTTIADGVAFDLAPGIRLEWTAEVSDGMAGLEITPGELSMFPQSQLSRLIVDNVPPSMPASLRWRHALDFPPGTQFIYQPELTAEEVAEGCVRPPAIVGSYAVLDASGVKLCHIPRPLAWDRDRVEYVWGTIEIVGGVSTVAFPKQPLRKLTAPVTIYGLDTFGYYNLGTPGGTEAANKAQDYIWGILADAPASSGTLVSISEYLSDDTNFDLTLGVYAGGGGSPDAQALVADAGKSTEGSAGGAWMTKNLAGEAVTGSTAYWLAHWHDRGTVSFWYDTVASTNSYAVAGDYSVAVGVLPDPFTSTPALQNNDRMYSIYATYTAVAGGQPTMRRWGGTPFMTPGPAPQGRTW